MRYFLGFLGMVLGFCLIKYRERVGDMFGEPAWASKVGGVYNVVIIVGVFFFFWGIAAVTHTEDVLFGPIFSLIPLPGRNGPGPTGVPGTEF